MNIGKLVTLGTLLTLTSAGAFAAEQKAAAAKEQQPPAATAAAPADKPAPANPTQTPAKKHTSKKHSTTKPEDKKG